MFFQNYFVWLQGVLTNFISTKIGVVAAYLDPVFVAFGVMYVMFWGYLHLIGKIEEPVLEGIKRIVILAVIYSLGLHLWSSHAVLVNAFAQGPGAMASAIVGAPPLVMVDSIWTQGAAIGGLFWANAGVLSGDFGLYFASLFVLIITGLVCVVTAFLLALAMIALAVLLAIGPLFILMLFFDSTKRFFEAWIAQLANYGLISILASLVAALLLTLVNTFAASTVAIGASIQLADAMYFLLSCVLTFLLLRQVMPIAAGLASGIALASGNIISRGLAAGLGAGRNMGRGMWDSATKAGTARYDPLSRKGGHALGQGARATAQAAWRLVRPTNTVKPK